MYTLSQITLQIDFRVDFDSIFLFISIDISQVKIFQRLEYNIYNKLEQGMLVAEYV